MSTIQPLNPNLGRTFITWTEANPSGPSAIIDGIVADYASVTGGENFDITAGGVGPTTITLLAGDVTAAQIRDRINATFVGLASVRTSGALRLEHPTDVAVSNFGTVVFDKVGLPIISKNVANVAATSFFMSSNEVEPGRIDYASNRVDIPPGANEASFWVSYSIVDAANRQSNPKIGIAWNNAVDGAGALTSLLNLYEDSVIFPPVALGLTEPAPLRPQEVGVSQLVLSGSLDTLPGSVFWRKLIRVAIPAGATQVRLVAFAAIADTAGDYPFIAPRLDASVTFAARLRECP